MGSFDEIFNELPSFYDGDGIQSLCYGKIYRIQTHPMIFEYFLNNHFSTVIINYRFFRDEILTNLQILLDCDRIFFVLSDTRLNTILAYVIDYGNGEMVGLLKP